MLVVVEIREETVNDLNSIAAVENSVATTRTVVVVIPALQNSAIASTFGLAI
jgi:hypothetical protein